MTFDKPQHKQLILDLLDKAQFPGHAVELVFELRKAISEGSVQGAPQPAEVQKE